MTAHSNSAAGTELTDAEREALIKEESDRIGQEDTLNDVRAEQQLIEGGFNADESIRRMERKRSLNQDEPGDDLDQADPVPLKGT